MWVKENSMTSKYLSGVLLIALGAALARPAEAQTIGKLSLPGPSTGQVIGAIVGAAAVVVVVTVVVIHYSKKRTITGCVNSGANGMTLTDEKDKQIYELSSNPEGIKPGDRMKLHGKRVKSKGPDRKLVWETKNVEKDFGVCQP
jgi:hypothetical protein